METREVLTGGTRTSVGDAHLVIDAALNDPSVLAEVYGLFHDDDPVVVMRSSYVAMRVAEQQPASVQPFLGTLLNDFPRYTQQEIRWHIPQLLAHVELPIEAARTVYDTLMHWAETDPSKIVAYYSLPTAAQLAQADDALLADFVPRLRALNARGAKSVSNRCRKIAKALRIDLDAPA